MNIKSSNENNEETFQQNPKLLPIEINQTERYRDKNGFIYPKGHTPLSFKFSEIIAVLIIIALIILALLVCFEIVFLVRNAPAPFIYMMPIILRLILYNLILAILIVVLSYINIKKNSKR